MFLDKTFNIKFVKNKLQNVCAYVHNFLLYAKMLSFKVFYSLYRLGVSLLIKSSTRWIMTVKINSWKTHRWHIILQYSDHPTTKQNTYIYLSFGTAVKSLVVLNLLISCYGNEQGHTKCLGIFKHWKPCIYICIGIKASQKLLDIYVYVPCTYECFYLQCLCMCWKPLWIHFTNSDEIWKKNYSLSMSHGYRKQNCKEMKSCKLVGRVMWVYNSSININSVKWNLRPSGRFGQEVERYV